jgi:hypothetical protein
MDIVGTWRLVTWRRYAEDGVLEHPFGEHPDGLLIYAPDGHMAVQMVQAGRPALGTDDALGGSEAERASAYSSCLAYFGRYRLDDEQVTHLLDGSLFPNWSGTSQARPFRIDDDQLVLEVRDENGRVTNEIAWRRAPTADPVERLGLFVQTSACLTGFSRTELFGTGVASEYLSAVDAAAPSAMVAELLTVLGDTEVADDVVARCLASPDLGPVARNVIVLWYTGSWQQLPEDWRRTYGRFAGDETRVVSAAAYLAGLQWKVVGAHAPGGDMQGFGSWATPPREGTR